MQSKEQAQTVPSPCTSYAMFYNGEFLTNEQFNDKKFLKMVQSK
ncbi:MAG: YoaP domain-containing protein [Clostridium sp.]|nr:YoaP domain-containing protein [Clostridium sp.]